MAGTVAFYGRLLDLEAAAGRAVGEVLAARWPDLLDEVEGMAAGAGVSAETLLAVQARTELMGGAECSVVAGVGEVAQNWDWHPEARWLVWVVEQPGGRWFATLTEAGMLAKIGLSRAGLCVGLNFLRCSLDGGVGGVPIHVLLRVLLDRVDDVRAAVALLASSQVTASSCITIASAAAPVAVELSPGGARVLRGDRLVHTNHFLAPLPAGTDVEALEQPSTFERLQALERGVSLAAPPLCRHGDPATLASVVMEPGRLFVADGPPCERPLREVALP